MISIFKNIRRNLVSNGKTTRYLKYALGEIFLVVIGILIALQINNWNENNIKENRRDILMQELRTDFLFNKDQLEYINKGILKSMTNTKKVIDMFPITDATNLDSLSYYLSDGDIFSWYTFNPRSGTVNSLINTSSFEIIENQELRTLLVGWDDAVGDYSEDEILANHFLSEQLNPYTFKYFEYDFDFSNPKNNLSMLRTLEFENLMKERHNSLLYIIEAGDRNDYLNLKKIINRVLELTSKTKD